MPKYSIKLGTWVYYIIKNKTDMKAKDNDSVIKLKQFRCIYLFLFLISTASTLFAQGNLLIFPKRVVFDGKKKVEKLVLSNTGKDTAVYSISFLEYKMSDNGDLKIISEPQEGLRFASTNVRVFPRKVTLAPNEAQTVKVELTNIHNLKDGESRSHLYFRAEEEKTPLGEIAQKKDSTISVNLKAIVGVSIPCIVRIGDNVANVTISDLKYSVENEKDDVLRFKLNRIGTISTYGDLIINYIDSNNKVYEVAKMNGIGIYTPNLFRYMAHKLNKINNVNFKSGTFKVLYLQNDSKKVLSEAELKL